MPETISEVIPAECQAVVLRVWDYLDGQLIPKRRRPADTHRRVPAVL